MLVQVRNVCCSASFFYSRRSKPFFIFVVAVVFFLSFHTPSILLYRAVPLLRVVAQCPGKLQNKSDIVIINQTSTKLSFISPPGEGMHHQIQLVQLGHIKSNVQLFSYDPPVIKSLSTKTSNTAGTGVLTVFGSNFGENPEIQIVYRKLETIEYNETSKNNTNKAVAARRQLDEPEGSTEAGSHIVTTKVELCELVPGEQTHESASCFIPEGQGNLHLIQIEVAGQISEGLGFGYDGPLVTSITPDSGDTKGNFNVTLTGFNFGLTAELKIGNATAKVVAQNHTHLVATAPGGIGLNNTVVLDVEGQKSNALNFAYKPPSIVVIYPNPADAHNGELITIEGRNFGADNSNVTVEIDGKPCTNAQWINLGGKCNTTDARGTPVCHPVVQCKTPSIQKIGGVSVRINVAEQEVFVDAEEAPILTLSCPFNMYGETGEFCQDCPVGALCPGQCVCCVCCVC